MIRASRADDPEGTAATATPPEALVLGEVSGVFGTRGWIKLHSHTRPRENIFQYDVWLIGHPGDWQAFRVLDRRVQGPTLVAALEGIVDRDAAAALHRRTIAVPRERLPAAEPGEFYWHDLIGCAVVNRAGEDFGRVRTLWETGANDVLVVDGERRRLIPFVRGQYVEDVDLAARRIVVDWHADD